MKVLDMRGTATRFDDIDVGDFFYEDDETNPQMLWYKMPVAHNVPEKSGPTEPLNAILLAGGRTRCFTAESRVQAVEVEVTVVKNAEGRPA